MKILLYISYYKYIDEKTGVIFMPRRGTDRLDDPGAGRTQAGQGPARAGFTRFGQEGWIERG